MACFEHPKGKTLEVAGGESVLLNRRPENKNDLIRAYFWAPCKQAAKHKTETSNKETMSIKAKLKAKKTFKSVGVCCDEGGERLALFVWPGNADAFEIPRAHR